MAKRQFTVCVCSDFVDAHESADLPAEGSDASYIVTKDEAIKLCEAATGKPVQVNHGQDGVNPDGTPRYNANTAIVGRITKAYLDKNKMLADIEIDTGDTDAGRIFEPFIDSGMFLGVSMSHFFGTDEFQEVSLLPKGARPNTGVLAELTTTKAPEYRQPSGPPDVQSRLRVIASAATRKRQEQQMSSQIPPRDPETGRFLKPQQEQQQSGHQQQIAPATVATATPAMAEAMANALITPPQQQQQETTTPMEEDVDVEITDANIDEYFQRALNKQFQNLTDPEREAMLMKMTQVQNKASALEQELSLREQKHKDDLKNHVDVCKSIVSGLLPTEQRQLIQNINDPSQLLVTASDATRAIKAELANHQAEKDLLLKQSVDMQTQLHQQQQQQQPAKRQRLEDKFKEIANTLTRNPYSQSQSYTAPTQQQTAVEPQQQQQQHEQVSFPRSYTIPQTQQQQQKQQPTVVVPHVLFTPNDGTPAKRGPWDGRLIVNGSAATRTSVGGPMPTLRERPDANAVVTHPKWAYEAKLNDDMIHSLRKFEHSEYYQFRDQGVIPSDLFSEQYMKNQVEHWSKARRLEDRGVNA